MDDPEESTKGTLSKMVNLEAQPKLKLVKTCSGEAWPRKDKPFHEIKNKDASSNNFHNVLFKTKIIE